MSFNFYHVILNTQYCIVTCCIYTEVVLCVCLCSADHKLQTFASKLPQANGSNPENKEPLELITYRLCLIILQREKLLIETAICAFCDNRSMQKRALF